MSTGLSIAIVIVLLIVGFAFLFFMPKPQVFFESYSNVTTIWPNFHDKITEEINKINDTSPLIPLYGFGVIHDNRYEFVLEMLRSMPYVRFAGIINLRPSFNQTSCYGFADVANHTIRYFYTVTESACNKSGIWIDGEKRFFSEKTWLCGDMSREHYLFNKDKYEKTTIIFIDIDRHPDIREGRSPNSSLAKDEILNFFKNEKL